MKQFKWSEFVHLAVAFCIGAFSVMAIGINEWLEPSASAKHLFSGLPSIALYSGFAYLLIGAFRWFGWRALLFEVLVVLLGAIAAVGVQVLFFGTASPESYGDGHAWMFLAVAAVCYACFRFLGVPHWRSRLRKEG